MAVAWQHFGQFFLFHGIHEAITVRNANLVIFLFFRWQAFNKSSIHIDSFVNIHQYLWENHRTFVICFIFLCIFMLSRSCDTC